MVVCYSSPRKVIQQVRSQECEKKTQFKNKHRGVEKGEDGQTDDRQMPDRQTDRQIACLLPCLEPRGNLTPHAQTLSLVLYRQSIDFTVRSSPISRPRYEQIDSLGNNTQKIENRFLRKEKETKFGPLFKTKTLVCYTCKLKMKCFAYKIPFCHEGTNVFTY